MIELKNIVKKYGDTGTDVFRDLCIHIEDGEFILLTGKSGSGKTTLLRLLLKETDYDAGKLYVNDRDLNTISRREIPYYRREIGVVFQESRLIEGMTVYQNIEMARLVVGGNKKDAGNIIASLMVLLGISDLHKRYPLELSGGQKQKVCLARALVNHPHLLLADEPTGNLDPQSSQEIMQLFELIHRQGVTVIVATHELETAKGLSYREIKL